MDFRNNTNILLSSKESEDNLKQKALESITNQYAVCLTHEEILLAHNIMMKSSKAIIFEYFLEDLLKINVNMYNAVLLYVIKTGQAPDYLHLIVERQIIGYNGWEAQSRAIEIYRVLLKCHDFDFKGLHIPNYMLRDLEEIRGKLREKLKPVENLPIEELPVSIMDKIKNNINNSVISLFSGFLW